MSQTNPFLPGHDDQAANQSSGYLLNRASGKRLQPIGAEDQASKNAAIAMIKRKLDDLYRDEPNALKEENIVQREAPPERSKHQKFMYELSISGKSLAEIQTAWHNYYINLPDNEKHAVWQEFYETSAGRATTYHPQTPQPTMSAQPQLTPQTAPATTPEPKAHVAEHLPPLPRTPRPKRLPRTTTLGNLKSQLMQKVQAQAKAQARAKQHLHSLLFGVGVGTIVLIITLFSFFNEVIITPFIQPNSHSSSTPIILSAADVAPSDTPEVIIPKINVEIPVDYNNLSIDENAIQKALETGVIHYPTTLRPGQQGNVALFGHSSNNIFNKGKYKFAFVLLHKLAPGDIFYLTYNNKVYTYKIYDKRVVEPNEVSVLDSVPGKTATATLITCDPPGTSLHRLVVWGEQVSPDPSGNAPSGNTAGSTGSTQLPSNGPTLWSRFWNWLF